MDELPMTAIEVNGEVSQDEWRSYVEHHPEGLVYHLPQWKETLEQSLRRQAFYLFARNSEGRLVGLLPLFQVKSPLTGNRLVSLPFTYICGPITDSELVEAQLVSRAQELCDELECRYLEIRAMRRLSVDMKVSEYFSTYILELSDDPSLVWNKLHQRHVRWAIGKAGRDGVTVTVDHSIEGIRMFNNLNQRSKRNLGVPGHPLVFLENMGSKLAEHFTLYLAEVSGRPIAGIVCLSFREGVIDAYAASDERYLGYHANDLLIWRAIEDGCKNGYRRFDFGKTSPDNEGLAHFKKKWGTAQHALYYHYYPLVPKVISSDRSGRKYQLLTGFWKKLPLSLAQAMGSKVFRHLD
jgi:FemAB-related protein (PEP-CTERM system-associated)